MSPLARYSFGNQGPLKVAVMVAELMARHQRWRDPPSVNLGQQLGHSVNNDIVRHRRLHVVQTNRGGFVSWVSGARAGGDGPIRCRPGSHCKLVSQGRTTNRRLAEAFAGSSTLRLPVVSCRCPQTLVSSHVVWRRLQSGSPMHILDYWMGGQRPVARGAGRPLRTEFHR